MTIYPLDNAAQTLAMGARLGRALRTGDCVALSGDLGAGKTTLVRGLVQSLLGEVEVPSPTYTLVQIYDLPNYELWHCDLYRLEQPDDAWELGLMDALGDAVCILEWPDKLGGLLPEDAIKIDMVFKGEGREIHISGLEARNV